MKRIVATGNSLTFNNLTANANDLALSPATNLPGVVYYDKQAPVSGTTAVGALKYAYMDSTGAWNIEVVDANYGSAACGTTLSFCVGAPNAAAGTNGVIAKIAYKSDGTPGIAYVFGASATNAAGYKQIRFAERSTSGAWTISVPFSSLADGLGANVSVTATIDPMKAVTLNFDASDRPHITFAFYSATIASSAVKYLSRSTSGIWTSNNVTTIVSGAGAISALGQGDNQHGAVLCTSGGVNYGPIVTTTEVTAAAGAGMTPRYSRCSTVNATTGACSAWVASQNLLTGCTGACMTGFTSNLGTRTDLIIDPATNKPLYGVFSTTTPATTLATILLPNTCEAAQTTVWGVPKVVGAASQGQFGFRLGASSTNWYIGYLTAATDVRVSYYNSGAWFAAGHIVETTTANTNGEGVGFAYDNNSTGGIANDKFYISYGQLTSAAAGAVGNDLKIGSGTTGELVTGGLAGTLVTEVIDNMYSTFPSSANAIPMLSAAKAPNGTIGFTYFFQDATVGSSRLYYGIRGGTTAAPVFGENIVTSHIAGGASPLFVGSYPSLTYDANSNPVIAFYNGVATEQNLNVARSFNGGASFNVAIVDKASLATANVGKYPSVATSGNAVGVAYYDVTNTGLKFARWTSAMGWRRFAIEGLTGGSCGTTTDDAGKYSKVAFTSAGLPVIAYQSNGTLRLAYAAEGLTSATYTWTCISPDPAGSNRGEGIDMVLVNDVPHIVHLDTSVGSIRYVYSSVAVTDSTFGASTFTQEVVGGSTTSPIVATPNIKITSAGTRYVTFYSVNFGAIGLFTKLSTGTSWTSEYLDAYTAGGGLTSVAGQYASLVLNSSEYPLAFYRSNENWLKYFSREPL